MEPLYVKDIVYNYSDGVFTNYRRNALQRDKSDCLNSGYWVGVWHYCASI